MKNQKAQALIEFVLILPVLIMFLFSIIDFGTIFIRKSELENKINDAYEAAKSSTDVSTLYSNIESAINKDSNKYLNELYGRILFVLQINNTNEFNEYKEFISKLKSHN